MSITDELREWAKEHLSRSSILAIADRIDAEHESAMYNMRREFEEWEHTQDTCYVKLPVDADGVPIRVGDVVEAGFYGTQEIAGVSGENSDFPYVFFFPDDGTEAQWCEAQDCHHHAPTVEDVLREFADAMSETHPLDVPARIAEYAAKLRLAGDAE